MTTLITAAPDRAVAARETATSTASPPGDEVDDVEGVFGTALALASSTTSPDSDLAIQADTDDSLTRPHPGETLEGAGKTLQLPGKALQDPGEIPQQPGETRVNPSGPLIASMTPNNHESELDASPQPGVSPVAEQIENRQATNMRAPQVSGTNAVSLTRNDNGSPPTLDIVETPATDIQAEASRSGQIANTVDTSADLPPSTRSTPGNAADHNTPTAIEVASTKADVAGNLQRNFDSTPRQYDDSRAALADGVDSFAALERNIVFEARSPGATEPHAQTVAENVRSQLVKAITLGNRSELTVENARIELELDPPELGRVWIQLTSNSSGVTAHMRASSEAAAALIESQMASLLESLQSEGMTIDDVHVDHQADFVGPDRHQSSARNRGRELDPDQQGDDINASREQLPARLPPTPGDGLVDIIV